MPTDGSGNPSLPPRRRHRALGHRAAATSSQLPAGDYEVGTDPNLGFPVIFVLDDATLAIEGRDGRGRHRRVDHALRQRNVPCAQCGVPARSPASPFQFPIFAMGQSHIEYEQASFYTLLPAYESAGYRGALFQVMGDQSTLTVTPGRDPWRGLSNPRRRVGARRGARGQRGHSQHRRLR